ncbi:MAG: molybdenum cofactor guanylyltransferase [Elusimicrobiota bacterium]
MKDTTGAVLAGGLSRRFGSDKSAAPWRGATLVSTVADVLSGVFDLTLVVVKDPAPFLRLERPGRRVVRDLRPEAHSLGGVRSALAHAATERVFVCACDMPFLDAGLVRGLAELGGGFDAVVPVWEGRLQPLCAVYGRACVPVIDRLLARTNPRVSDVFDLVRTRFVTEEDIRTMDPQGRSFMDLDTRAEYERAREAASC